jgi:hypothetical protein
MAALLPLVLVAAAGAAPPRADDALTRDRGWDAGSIAAQLNGDTTMVPFGKGAIFIPAMTNPLDEPPVSVWQNGKKVEEGTTGRRILVFPGTYNVRIGSGAVEQTQNIQVSVRELNTSVVPPSWAGLVVHMVDEAMNSLRGSYELIRVDEREYMGIGFGSDEQAGEPVSTWLLEPGLYKIVRVGETYRARRDYVTVRLVPGNLTHFQLTQDAETGDFRGGGEVPREELFQFQRGRFWTTLILGGDLSLFARRNVSGTADGETFALRAFIDTKLSAEIFDSPLILRLQVEEGQTSLPDSTLQQFQWPWQASRWQKTQDRADIDGLYVLKLKPWIGPYLRGEVETNLLNGFEYFDQPQDVLVQSESGRERLRRTQISQLRIASPLALTKIKEGLGLNVRLFKTVYGETTIRAGVGARHSLTRGLLEFNSTAADGTRVYVRKRSTHQVGVEGTIVAVARLTRWVLVNLEVDTLLPFDDLEQPILEVEGTVAVKLTRYISINYVLRHLRDPTLYPLSPETGKHPYPLENDVLLRFSVDII